MAFIVARSPPAANRQNRDVKLEQALAIVRLVVDEASGPVSISNGV
jgi:hypothetical protein